MGVFSNLGAFKYYISTLGGLGGRGYDQKCLYCICNIIISGGRGVQNLGKPAYIILARSPRVKKKILLDGMVPTQLFLAICFAERSLGQNHCWYDQYLITVSVVKNIELPNWWGSIGSGHNIYVCNTSTPLLEFDNSWHNTGENIMHEIKGVIHRWFHEAFVTSILLLLLPSG